MSTQETPVTLSKEARNRLQAMAAELDQNPDYRVLRRFDPGHFVIDEDLPDDVSLGMILDTETTGREETDKIIELGMVVFAYNKQTGHIYGVVEVYNELEDPGMPIPPEASRVNHITDEMVAGKRIDDARVQELVESVDFILAHNSGFDRGFCERRFPFFKAKPWACSLAQVDWEAAGISSAKLEFIAYRLGFFYDAHRAEADCLALLYALSQELPEVGGTAFSQVLQNFTRKARRVWAVGSPFEAKDLLKARGYRWSDGSKPGFEKAWYMEVPDEEFEAEMAWLKESVFGNRSFSVPVDTVDEFSRFTDRRTGTQRIYR